MYCLTDFCCICFYNKGHLQPLSCSDSDNITYFIKLTSCVPETCLNQINHQRLICNECCETMDAAYKFRQKCLKSNATLTDYISQLHQISNINGAANVYLTDINKFGDLKKAYQKENNIKHLETFIQVNGDANEKENVEINSITAIKRKNSPICSKLIETGPNCVELGNVIVKLEQKNENSEEYVDYSLNNLFVNQDDNKIDDNLTASAIKKENEYQDFEEHLHERFDNTLETFKNENEDMSAKVEENNDSPLYSKNYFGDPLANLDEIKIERVDNDIELMNDQINIQYKTEDIEEFSTEDNVIPYEDKTDKETITLHKSLEVKQEQQKKCDLVNRNVKIAKKHECSICKRNFLQSSHLNAHMTIHTGEKSHECSVCQKKFSRSGNLKEHMRTHTGEKPYECDVCQKKFAQSGKLKQHMKLHTGEKPYECDLCQKKFTQSQYLKEHVKIHTGEKPYACDVCQKHFSQSRHLTTHMRIHTGEKPHECSVCLKKFANLTNLKEHMITHTGEKPYQCDVCQNKFTRSNRLKEHMSIHTGIKPYECDVCQKKFTLSCSLKEHMSIHTGDKLYGCDVCQKKFSRSQYLKEHMRTHTGEKPYECDVCLKKFTQPSSLKEHMRIHTGEKPYGCDVCQKKFTRSQQLKEHMKTHTGGKPYGCDVCQKKFTQLRSLKKHMSIHTDGKTLECSVCREKFFSSTALQDHMQNHTGEKPYEKPHQCSVCLLKFMYLSTLTKHMTIHIGEKA